ncbi:MAG: radical SAM protein [Candidatus Omnitrophica bacterium]|nr:radical SAM protein [Candidatus Omnitrophota bacterium]MDD5546477.1 radical SAM protein [Candidatus Omnitrophota bacterium]
MKNYAFCNTCKDVVPVEHVEKDGKVYLRKSCPKCGTEEYLISSDAGLYNKKRDFMSIECGACALNCPSCNKHKEPDIVFIDTTNRCNMNCHICLNNVLSMGFKFEPRMEYFDRIFKHYAHRDPKPYIQLFGGEPTMRNDLFDIIKLGKSYGYSMRVVTNGLKLADEEYCNKLADLGAMINIAFDGLNREMYTKLRGHPEALDLKLKALGNLAKRKKAKVVLMSVVDKELNKNDMGEFLSYSLKNQHVIRGIYFMPLIHMWDAKQLDYDPERTTHEDVEHMVEDAVAGGNVEFVPLGSLFLTNLYKIYGIKNMPFLGVHPNCESITYLISDGEKYVSFSKYLKTSLFALINDLRALEKFAAGKYKGGKAGFSGKLALDMKLFNIFRKHLNFGAIVGKKGPAAYIKWAGMIGKLLTGKKAKEVLKNDTKLKGVLQIMILPFEDSKTTESERLSMCSSCFVYVDPDTDKIRTLPTCTWEKYKKPIMKKVAEKFNV